MKMQPMQFNYTSFGENETDEAPNESVLIHIVPENKSKWNHIEDLDAFFTRIYHYHQQHGFTCMMLQEFLELVQFAFVVGFSAFLMQCVDYQVLFRDKILPSDRKVTLSDAILGPQQCVATFGPALWVCLAVALVVWVLRAVGVLYHLFQYWEIRNFYHSALHISDSDLDNTTWHEVQQKLRLVQKDYQMCIHKQELSELDIYHRILRFKNYFVAMVNKSVLPLKFNLPFMGDTVFLTRSLKYNIEFLLFWGPWAPFENSWHLKDDYRRPSKRRELANQLSRHITYLGLLNFLLSPLILVWQLLYAFFNYAEVVKREPGSLGTRRWSLYGRLYLRHFNELDHEFQARLNRAYRPAVHYLSGFSSNLAAVIAKNVAFLCGSVLAVLLILTVYDEDVITVEHVLTIMTVLGAVIAGCRVFIPEENLVWCPETLMEAILAQVHYLPTEWKGKAHTAQVRGEFAQLFQYKAVYMLEELLSPLVTPFILYYAVRPKSLEIVDFFRNFTVDVVGVGDVCSFAQLDINRHGNTQWQSSIKTESTPSINSFSKEKPNELDLGMRYRQAEDGKTELSLVHFALTNPEWRPPRAAEDFLNALRSQMQQDTSFRIEPLLLQQQGWMSTSSTTGLPYPGMINSYARPNLTCSVQNLTAIGRGITKTEGPRTLPENRCFVSSISDSGPESLQQNEPVAVNMAASALYLHDLQHRQPQVSQPSSGRAGFMPGISESPDEEESGAAALASAAAAAIDKIPNIDRRMAKSN